MRDQSAYLNQVLQRYSDTISGLFYGHVHQEQFAEGYSNDSEKTAITANLAAFIAPAITPGGTRWVAKIFARSHRGLKSFFQEDIDHIAFTTLIPIRTT